MITVTCVQCSSIAALASASTRSLGLLSSFGGIMPGGSGMGGGRTPAKPGAKPAQSEAL